MCLKFGEGERERKTGREKGEEEEEAWDGVLRVGSWLAGQGSGAHTA